jgi:hypothetical protein
MTLSEQEARERWSDTVAGVKLGQAQRSQRYNSVRYAVRTFLTVACLAFFFFAFWVALH